jgi:hypothetical protein
MNLMSRPFFVLLAIVALGLVSPAPLQAWQWDDGGLKRMALPSTLQLVAAGASADFDEDGTAEAVVARAGRATIRSGAQIRWQSPPAWRAEQAQVADLNRDGRPEAVLLVWRAFKPWPVDAWLPHGGRIEDFHDDNGMSCHIILIGWKQGVFRELWAGSALADPITRFTVADLRGNGSQYLVTLEGVYDDPPSVPARRLKVWEWNGFGFTNVHELEESFNLIAAAQMDDRQILILSR